MDETNIGEFDTLNEQENDTLLENDMDTEETAEELRERLEKEIEARKKAEEIAQNQKIRAEKIEKKFKEAPQKSNQEISSTDLFALVKANVAMEDLDDIKDYAKLKNISIAEALGTSFIKSVIADKAEQRRVAEATNTGNTRRSSGKVSDEVLLENARKGNLPDSDEDLRRLIAARQRK